METGIVQAAARYAEKELGSEGFRYVSIEESFIELYQSLNTESAHDMAREKFGRVLDFLDGVIEHVSDATPV